MNEELQQTPLTPDPVSEKRHSFKTEAWETIRFIIIALAIVIPVRMFIAQPFIVSGASMDPTFENGEYLIVDELSYRLREPQRGDVVIFKYPKDPKKFFIKRLIGLPGETVSLKDGIVTVKNTSGTNVTMNEPYIKLPKIETINDRTLKDGEYFMMGDNRAGSFDSRMWGPVPRESIVGRALVRLFPFTKIDLMPGAINQ